MRHKGCFMRLDHLLVQDFRNIRQVEIFPGEELTVIAGDNGQGKTSLLESIFLLTGSKSFRGAKDKDLVNDEAGRGTVRGKSLSGQRESNIDILIEKGLEGKKGRFAKVNGVDYGRASAIAGIFTAVVFEPGHLNLVKSGPDGRRRFLDAALCQLYPNYITILRRFTRALIQKNALLRNYYRTPDADGILTAFDGELSSYGAEITRRRAEYLAKAGPAAERYYTELASGAENLHINFCPSTEPEQLGQLLAGARAADIRAGFSTAGPHREDFEVLVKEKSARVFGSQGQQRSAVLALKLAEAEVARVVTGEHPVLLLDDVLSELDESRQAYLLERMNGMQSFVTCCDASAFGKTRGHVLQVQNGAMLAEKIQAG